MQLILFTKTIINFLETLKAKRKARELMYFIAFVDPVRLARPIGSYAPTLSIIRRKCEIMVMELKRKAFRGCSAEFPSLQLLLIFKNHYIYISFLESFYGTNSRF